MTPSDIEVWNFK